MIKPIPAAIALILVACATDAPQTTRPALAEATKLTEGSYDIPYFVEPARSIELVLHEVKLDELESEYSVFQPHRLNSVRSAHPPRRVSAYKYNPRLEDIRDVSSDEAQVRSTNSMVQICISGLNCVDFYMRGEVILLEFEGEAEAATYTKNLLASELSKLAYLGKPQPHLRHGATFVDSSLAFRQSGRYCYIVSSRMPDTIDAILESTG